MSEIVAVTKERHAGRTWQRSGGYKFAAKDPVTDLAAQEVPRAMMSMTVAFMETGGNYIPVAVQGLRQGQNKFVSRDGRWLGEYVPALYRAYPFRLGRNQDGVEVLCIDEQAGRVSTEHNGEPFFMPNGSPAPGITEAFKLLVEIERDRQKLQKACETLTRHGLLEPWPLKAQDGNELLEARGLFRVVEAKLYALDPAALAEVRDSGGLMLAYGQLFSMQHVQVLGKLGLQSRAISETAAPAVFEENGIISFSNL